MATNAVSLNENNTVVIGTTTEATTCPVSGATIAAGETVLALRPYDDAGKEETRVVSASGLTTFTDWLRDASEGDTLDGAGGSPVAEHGDYAYLTHPCIACGERYKYGGAVVFRQTVRAPWCHSGCGETVLEAVERAWEETDRFLADQL